MTEEEIVKILIDLADRRLVESRRTMGFVAQERLQAEANAIRAGAVALGLMTDVREYLDAKGYRKLSTTRDTLEKGLALIDRLLGRQEPESATP